MCGIAGIFHYGEPDRTIDRDLLVRMTRMLAHRGPDGEGFHIEGGLGLGHRRLAIVDLSPAGAQPMPNADRSCWIAYNGEFYNHASFRKGLAARGYRFRSSSDTETLLCLLEDRGPDSLSDAMGIFAFAFWEARRQRLTLARDHMGVKQLYYHDNGRRIVFASEIKALLVCPGVPREPDFEGINQYLHFHTALFDRTLFRGIRQLRAGEYLQITRTSAKLRTYWSIDSFEPRGGNEEENVSHLRDRLSSVVGEQLMSDVPVGSFLSGGIDSSAIAAFAARNGNPPRCFGIHFSHQGVPDERPYQEAVAKALGLRLDLATVNGSDFPADLMKLMYHQDEPVIGPAMIPMYYVSKLASQSVKVCLGGQGADEVFGGYARYALAHPTQVMQLWASGKRAGAAPARPESAVGGNLWRQLAQRRNLERIARNLHHLLNWESAYFEHFARIPEAAWKALLSEKHMIGREQCRRLFHETIRRSPTGDPAARLMWWDVRTYLPGLFHQDDRMSMAASLESRVPLADPRIVELGFHTGFGLKFRNGASKWILRKAVSDVLPAWVLNRRKVGFDTPAENWMKGQHAGFVRDLLLSKQARERGMWDTRGMEMLLGTQDRPGWFDVAWKAVSLEAWASIFLDGSSWLPKPHDGAPAYVYSASEPAALAPSFGQAGCIELRDAVQAVREDGVVRASRRIAWELKMRSGFAALVSRVPGNPIAAPQVPRHFAKLFHEPRVVAEAMRGQIPPESLARLSFVASEAARGRILSFGRWIADYGNPIDWHRNPLNGHRWPVDAHGSKVLSASSQTGDVKFTWEAARFPQAYLMARAASFATADVEELSSAFFVQVSGFSERNPCGIGVHWSSSQEAVWRLLAWIFGTHAFGCLDNPMEGADQLLASHAAQCARHIRKYLEYSKRFVYNNHLLAEALGLELAQSEISEGHSLLTREANRQVYSDGGSIQQSHNYHRVAMQTYLVACAIARAKGDQTPPAWTRAMERSLDFLLAQQNPVDGALPNFGSNDGSLPLVLSCCAFSDFRPTLQALSLATRGERIYERGPWDEEACWLLGPESLAAPLRPPRRRSISYVRSGHHVLRGRNNANFATFRCGDQLDRFSQMDMLHLNICWRGHDVMVDGGTYLYSGPVEWHRHFLGTGSHNTIQLDGRDQMAHVGRFRTAYRTKARLLEFEDGDEWALCSGEHDGYRRHPGQCVHRRSVLFLKDDLWVVADHISGEGAHSVRLHWLGGDYPWRSNPDAKVMLQLETASGAFNVAVFDAGGLALSGDVVAGRADPPRGWLARHYGHKKSVPSLAVETRGPLPLTLLSVLGPHDPFVAVEASVWTVSAGNQSVTFELSAGRIVKPRIVKPMLLVAAPACGS